MTAHESWLTSFKNRVDVLRQETRALHTLPGAWSGSLSDAFPSSLRELQREIITRLSWHRAQSVDMLDFLGFKTLVDAANYLYPPEAQATLFVAPRCVSEKDGAA